MKPSPARPRGPRPEAQSIASSDDTLEDDVIELAFLIARSGPVEILLSTQLIAAIAKAEADHGETAALAIVEKAERSVIKSKRARPS